MEIDTLERERLELLKAEESTEDSFVPAQEAKPFDPQKEELVIRVEL